LISASFCFEARGAIPPGAVEEAVGENDIEHRIGGRHGQRMREGRAMGTCGHAGGGAAVAGKRKPESLRRGLGERL